MNFLHPGLAAAALAAISIPVLIHLLMRRRRRPIRWAAMRFLLEAYRQHRRRLRLEQWLLLAARCLMVGLAGLAIARPILGSSADIRRGPRTLYLVIDNGLASGADDGAGPALDRHRAAALEAIDALDAAAGDRVAILTLGAPPEALVVPPTTDVGSAASIVRELEPVDSASDLHAAFAALAAELSSSGPGEADAARVLVLSDARAGSADIQRPLPPLPRGREIELRASRPADAGLDNIAITSVRPLRPVLLVSGSGATQVLARASLRRSGPAASGPGVTKVRAHLEDDGRSISQAEAIVRWAPGQSEAVASLDLATSGDDVPRSAVIRAEIDRDAIQADNAWRCPVDARRALRVGIAAPRRFASGALTEFDAADWIERALAPAADSPDAPEVVSFDPASLDASRLAGLDAVVLTRPDSILPSGWSVLRQFADVGGLVLVVPPVASGAHLWPDALASAMELDWSIGREPRRLDPPVTIAADRDSPAHPLLAELTAELPDLARPVSVMQALAAELAAESPDRVLNLSDGSPLLLASAPGGSGAGARGLIVVFTATLSFEWTDLQTKPLIVPLTQEIVRQGVGLAHGSSTWTAGRAPSPPASAVELRPLDADRAPLAADARGQFPPIRRAGVWRALDDRGADRGLIAINPDPAGSRTDTQPAQAVEAWLAAAAPSGRVAWIGPEHEPSGGAPAPPSGAGRLVLLLLAGAMVVTLAELAMARRFSHAGAAA